MYALLASYTIEILRKMCIYVPEIDVYTYNPRNLEAKIGGFL